MSMPPENRPPIAPKVRASPIRPTRDQAVVLYVVCISPTLNFYPLLHVGSTPSIFLQDPVPN
jgi:hypothetical protein